MGFRFRKSIKILPGIKLNVTQKGISSASIGRSGATMNISKKGTRTTVGLPGTGLSYSKYQSHQHASTNTSQQQNTDDDVSRGQIEDNPPPTQGHSIGIIIFWVIIAFVLGAIIF